MSHAARGLKYARRQASGVSRAIVARKLLHNPEPCLIAIDAEDRKTLSLEARAQRADMLELLIAVGTGVGGDLLAVDAQREIHLVQKTSHRIGRDRNVDLLKNLGDLLGGLASPL